jgi:hypothetical protein
MSDSNEAHGAVMADQLDQLQPIIEVVGPGAVSADYSDHQIWSPRQGRYLPGWKVQIRGTYKGARIQLSEVAATIDEAAAAANAHLRTALGLK